MKKFIIKLIEDYQHDSSRHTTKKCRYLPTCSNYAIGCYKRFNFFYASFLTIRRIIRCNPLHKMAYDPVPEERKYRYKYKTIEESILDYDFKRSMGLIN